MNAQGRKRMQDTLDKLAAMRSELEAIGEQLQEMAQEEREKFDSLPDSLQESEAGQKFEEIADQLDEAVSACESGYLGDAIEALELA